MCSLTPTDFSLIDNMGRPKRYTGKVIISAGDCQPDAQLAAAEKAMSGVVIMK